MNYVDNPFQSPATISICPGILGLERGVERAIGPILTIAYAEIEAFPVANILAGMEAGILAPAPVWTNVKTFPWRFFRGKVDLLIGGYPCQPFSTAGKRKGKDDPRHLWPYLEGGIDTARPVCVWFENVLGHLSLGFDQVTDSLRSMGYCVEAGIYTAAEVGAPHKRARVFILGILADAKDYVRGLYERRWRSGETVANAACHLLDGCRNRGASRRNEPADGNKIMDDSGSFGFGSEFSICPGRYGTESAGEDVAHTNGAEWGKINSHESGIDTGKSDLQRDGKETTSGLEQRSEALADGIRTGLEIGEEQYARPKFTTIERGSYFDRWPAGPGQPQYSWEEPRTIEPGMGCTVDGYDYREDLLRALGNSVVEQTAELAFRTLMKKHEITL